MGCFARDKAGRTFLITTGDAVSVDSSGTVTFSLFGTDVLYVSAANYNFIMETSEPLESSEEGDE